MIETVEAIDAVGSELAPAPDGAIAAIPSAALSVASATRRREQIVGLRM